MLKNVPMTMVDGTSSLLWQIFGLYYFVGTESRAVELFAV